MGRYVDKPKVQNKYSQFFSSEPRLYASCDDDETKLVTVAVGYANVDQIRAQLPRRPQGMVVLVASEIITFQNEMRSVRYFRDECTELTKSYNNRNKTVNN